MVPENFTLYARDHDCIAVAPDATTPLPNMYLSQGIQSLKVRLVGVSIWGRRDSLDCPYDAYHGLPAALKRATASVSAVPAPNNLHRTMHKNSAAGASQVIAVDWYGIAGCRQVLAADVTINSLNTRSRGSLIQKATDGERPPNLVIEFLRHLPGLPKQCILMSLKWAGVCLLNFSL